MTDRDRTREDYTSPSRYNSFLLRCWHVGEGELRIKVEHVQSGDSTRVVTFQTAVAWLSVRCTAFPDGEEVPQDEGARNRSEREASEEKHER